MTDTTDLPQGFADATARLPLLAILRGVTPEEVVPIGQALLDQGFNALEVPLNSPDALHSVALLRHAFPKALVGAGTVTQVAEVAAVKAAGGQLVVSPNFDPAVVLATRQAGLLSLPGVCTPSEAFAALGAGVHGLKLFPAELVPPPVLKAMRAVLPPSAQVWPVGGITPAGMAAYLAAGAHGFGLGSALYQPGFSAHEVGRRAADFANAYRLLRP